MQNYKNYTRLTNKCKYNKNKYTKKQEKESINGIKC